MTREEAIEVIKDIYNYTKWDTYTTNEARTMAIKALEQEPCSDVVSIQAVETLVDELARAISDERCCISRGRSTATIMQDILDLPPVNPQEPKSGHWIEKEGFDGDTYYDCSVCGESFCLIDGTPTDNLYKYCPNCGARMESEE